MKEEPAACRKYVEEGIRALAFLVPLANSDAEASQLEMKAPAEKGGGRLCFCPFAKLLSQGEEFIFSNC